ncbi:MAG: hypothetical protein R2812_06305 [Gelidibacter sp.]
MTKQISFLLLLVFTMFSCKPTQTIEKQEQKNSKNAFLKDVKHNPKSIEYRQLSPKDLTLLKNYLKTTFNKDLDSLNYLTISYLKPMSDCWYNSYSQINTLKSKLFFDALKKQMNTDLLCAHYETKFVSTYSNVDAKKLLYKLFSNGYKACDFTVTINKLGMYYFKAGHFEVDVANAFKNELDKNFHL